MRSAGAAESGGLPYTWIRSKTASSGTHTAKPCCCASTAVALTHPDVELPTIITWSTLSWMRCRRICVPANALAKLFWTTISPSLQSRTNQSTKGNGVATRAAIVSQWGQVWNNLRQRMLWSHTPRYDLGVDHWDLQVTRRVHHTLQREPHDTRHTSDAQLSRPTQSP